jgi:hypothetical protein
MLGSLLELVLRGTLFLSNRAGFPFFICAYSRLTLFHLLFLLLLSHGYGHSVAYLGPWTVSHRRSKNIRGVRTKGTGRFVSEDSLSGIYLYLLDLGLTPDPPMQHPCEI